MSPRNAVQAAKGDYDTSGGVKGMFSVSTEFKTTQSKYNNGTPPLKGEE